MDQQVYLKFVGIQEETKLVHQLQTVQCLFSICEGDDNGHVRHCAKQELKHFILVFVLMVSQLFSVHSSKHPLFNDSSDAETLSNKKQIINIIAYSRLLSSPLDFISGM